jgi:hypothetical protein
MMRESDGRCGEMENKYRFFGSPPPNLPHRAIALWGLWYVRGPVLSE